MLLISRENVCIAVGKHTAVTLDICCDIFLRLMHINLTVLSIKNNGFLFAFYCCVVLDLLH